VSPVICDRRIFGGQDSVGKRRGGRSAAMLTWIAMPSGGSAASVLCGRQLRQSRQRTVDATVVTAEQRDAGTPGHARTFPVRTCQPTAGAKRTGVGPKRAEAYEADVAFVAAAPTTSGATATMSAMRGERHTLELRSETRTRSVILPTPHGAVVAICVERVANESKGDGD
jgi:hypothetical protein